jgi:RNA polymerase sigma-70 factor (ECF subfamily)
METSKRQFCRVTDTADSAAAVARAVAELSDADLMRLNALARLRARGLPDGILWSDLLHEALARALDGSRQWPADVPFLTFVSSVMRSLCDKIWRRHRREAAVIIRGKYDEHESRTAVCTAAGQERILAAIPAISAIRRLFAGDQIATRIIAGMADGLSAEEIRRTNNISQLD